MINQYTARRLGYERITFSKDWQVTCQVSARRLYEAAIILASAEGNPLHAETLKVRLSQLPRSARYVVGRLANGCQTAEVVVV
jgi:hypothetical protein